MHGQHASDTKGSLPCFKVVELVEIDFQSPVPTHTLSCNVVVIIADMEPVRFFQLYVDHVVCTLSVRQIFASHVTNTSPELPYSSVENNFYLKEITKTSTVS